jgi:hypothetical protein
MQVARGLFEPRKQTKTAMTKHLKNKQSALIAKLRQDFPTSLLVAAMGFVMQARRERAGISSDIPLSIAEPEQQLDEFLNASSIRQLKMLREMAKGMEATAEVVTDPAELAMIASMQRKQ